MTLLAREAEVLAHNGFKIFPCKPKDKVPAVPWKDHATSDLEVVRAWWGAWPQCNIGIAMGKLSGVFVLDIDGEEGEASLRKLESEHGPLPQDTIEARTARGRHLYFRMPPHPISNSAGLVGPHLDIRGDGGYVIAPPSVHPSGDVYRWAKDIDAFEFADAPTWLLDAATAKRNGNGKSKTDWHALLTADIPDGQRNITLARLAGLLIGYMLPPRVVCDLLQAYNVARCQPPLHPHEVEGIVVSILETDRRRP
jgi:Bifunctional DNA primase/polymerase, N-terminal/Primase C terminal 1 (PriCT-1)